MAEPGSVSARRPLFGSWDLEAGPGIVAAVAAAARDRRRRSAGRASASLARPARVLRARRRRLAGGAGAHPRRGGDHRTALGPSDYLVSVALDPLTGRLPRHLHRPRRRLLDARAQPSAGDGAGRSSDSSRLGLGGTWPAAILILARRGDDPGGRAARAALGRRRAGARGARRRSWCSRPARSGSRPPPTRCSWAVGAWAVALVRARDRRPAAGARTRSRSPAACSSASPASSPSGSSCSALIPLAVAARAGRARPLILAAARRRGGRRSSSSAAGYWWLDGLRDDARAVPRKHREHAPVRLLPDQQPGRVRARRRPGDRRSAWRGCATARLWLLVGGGLAAVAIADLSGMSKGEVERIWLPFLPWVLLAAAALPQALGAQRALLAPRRPARLRSSSGWRRSGERAEANPGRRRRRLHRLAHRRRADRRRATTCGCSTCCIRSLTPARPDYLNPEAEYVWADVRDPAAAARAVADVDAVSHQAAMVGLGVDANDMPRLRQPQRPRHRGPARRPCTRAASTAGSCSRAAWSSTARAATAASSTASSSRRPAPPRSLAAGEFEPPCPRLRRVACPGARPRVGARSTRATSTPRPSSTRSICARATRARPARACHRPALPQRLRAADAARHALRRRRQHLSQRARGRPRAHACSRTAASCATSSTSRDVAVANRLALDAPAGVAAAVQRRLGRRRAASATSPASSRGRDRRSASAR